MNIGLAIFAALQAADIATTRHALAFGHGHEANPFMMWAAGSTLAMLAVKVVVVGLWWFGTNAMPPRLAAVMLIFGCVSAAAVVAHNLWIIIA